MLKSPGTWTRRRVIQSAASLTVASGVKGIAKVAAEPGVSLVIERGDPLANSHEVLWAAKELETTLAGRGAKVIFAGETYLTESSRSRKQAFSIVRKVDVC